MVGFFTACSSLSSAERAEREARLAQKVETALAERQYTINVDMMFPRRGRAVHVSSDYSVQVKGDTLISYLPYFGRAYNVPYGGGKGLNFAAPIRDYQAAKDSKGRTQVIIKVDNEEDILNYTLDIFSNGKTSVDVMAREREPISYNGQMEIE